MLDGTRQREKSRGVCHYSRVSIKSKLVTLALTSIDSPPFRSCLLGPTRIRKFTSCHYSTRVANCNFDLFDAEKMESERREGYGHSCVHSAMDYCYGQTMENSVSYKITVSSERQTWHGFTNLTCREVSLAKKALSPTSCGTPSQFFDKKLH
jgi:hypothetical protein